MARIRTLVMRTSYNNEYYTTNLVKAAAGQELAVGAKRHTVHGLLVPEQEASSYSDLEKACDIPWLFVLYDE